MGEWEIGGEIVPEVADAFVDGAFAEGVGLGIAADEEGKADAGHVGEDGIAPQGRAFGAWGFVSAVGEAAWVAEAHREDGDFGGIVEIVFGEGEPFTEAFSRRVVEGFAAEMGLGAGGLAGDQDFGGGGDVDKGPGAEWEVFGANAALADIMDDARQ